MSERKTDKKKLILPKKIEENFSLVKLGLVLFLLLCGLLFALYKINQKKWEKSSSEVLFSLKKEEENIETIEYDVLKNNPQKLHFTKIGVEKLEEKNIFKNVDFGQLQILPDGLNYTPLNGFLGTDNLKFHSQNKDFLLKLNVVSCNAIAGDGIPDCEFVCDFDTQNEIVDCQQKLCETENILDNGTPFCSAKNQEPESKELVLNIEPTKKNEQFDLKNFILSNIKDPDNSLPLKIENIQFFDKIFENDEQVILNAGKHNILTFNKNEQNLSLNLNQDLGQNSLFFNVSDAFGAKNLMQKLTIKIACKDGSRWNENLKICEEPVKISNIADFKCVENQEFFEKTGSCTLPLKENNGGYFVQNLQVFSDQNYSQDCQILNESLKIPYKKKMFLKCKNIPFKTSKLGQLQEKYILKDFLGKTAEIEKNTRLTDCAGVGAEDVEGVKKCKCDDISFYDESVRKCVENLNLQPLVFNLKFGEKLDLKTKIDILNSETVENIKVGEVYKIAGKIKKGDKVFNQQIYINAVCGEGEFWDGRDCKKDPFAGVLSCLNKYQNAVEGGVIDCNLGKIENTNLVLSSFIPEKNINKCEQKNGELWCKTVFENGKNFYIWKNEGERWQNISKVDLTVNELFCAKNAFADKKTNSCVVCPSGEFVNENNNCQKCQNNTIFNSQTNSCQSCGAGESPNFAKNSCVVCNDVPNDGIPDCFENCQDNHCFACEGGKCEQKSDFLKENNLKICQVNGEIDDGVLQCSNLEKCDNVAKNNIPDCTIKTMAENCDIEADNGVLDCKKVGKNDLEFVNLNYKWGEDVKINYVKNGLDLKIENEMGGAVKYEFKNEQILLKDLSFGKNILNYWQEDQYKNISDKKQFVVNLSCPNGQIYDEKRQICGTVIDIKKLDDCKTYPAILAPNQYFSCNFKLSQNNNLLPINGVDFENEAGVKYPCFLEKRQEGEFLNCSSYTRGGFGQNYFILKDLENVQKITKNVEKNEFLNDFMCDNVAKNDVPDCIKNTQNCDFLQDNGVENCAKNENVCDQYLQNISDFLIKNENGENLQNYCEYRTDVFALQGAKIYFILGKKDQFLQGKNELFLVKNIRILSQIKIDFSGKNYTLKRDFQNGFYIYDLKKNNASEEEIISLKWKTKSKKYWLLTVFAGVILMILHYDWLKQNLGKIKFIKKPLVKNIIKKQEKNLLESAEKPVKLLTLETKKQPLIISKNQKSDIISSKKPNNKIMF